VRTRGLAAISTGLFCVQLDCFAMNLALPRMASELGSTATDLQWVISNYMVTLGAFIVPPGRIGDVFGRKRALLTGIALFGVPSALCAVASSAEVVIAMRVVQGIGRADLPGVGLRADQRAASRYFQPRHRIGLRHSGFG
jgi:MFS family permease